MRISPSERPSALMIDALRMINSVGPCAVAPAYQSTATPTTTRMMLPRLFMLSSAGRTHRRLLSLHTQSSTRPHTSKREAHAKLHLARWEPQIWLEPSILGRARVNAVIVEYSADVFMVQDVVALRVYLQTPRAA